MLVDKRLAPCRLDEVVAAILAATTLTADGRDDVLALAQSDGVAWQAHDATDEKRLFPTFRAITFHRLARIFRLRGDHALHRIGENYRLATPKSVAINPVHYHSVAPLQVRRQTARRHRIDSECIGADYPSEEQCQHQRDQEFDSYFQTYLILSTNVKRRFQRIPEKPGWSGLWLHQMKIGLPTIWSSGTKPQ